MAYEYEQENYLQQISTVTSIISYVKFNTENGKDTVRELAPEKYTLCPQKVPTFKLALTLSNLNRISMVKTIVMTSPWTTCPR